MKVVFFGIYGFGVAAGDQLLRRGVELAAVVTKPSGPDDQQPVATWAADNHLRCVQPTTPSHPDVVSLLRDLRPEVIAVAGYHKRIPAQVLAIPSWGTVNTHASLLPAYRGPAAHKWVIVRGERQTGVTTHVMTEQFDDGDILNQRTVPITDNDTGQSLFTKLTPVAAQLLADTLGQIEAGTVQRRPQDRAKASYFSYPSEADADVRWDWEAQRIRNLVRGLWPRPGAWTKFDGQVVRLAQCEITSHASGARPGTIIDANGNRARIATGSLDVIVRVTGDADSSVALAPGDRLADAPERVRGL